MTLGISLLQQVCDDSEIDCLLNMKDEGINCILALHVNFYEYTLHILNVHIRAGTNIKFSLRTFGNKTYEGFEASVLYAYMHVLLVFSFQSHLVSL